MQRFSVTMPEDLMTALDALAARRGTATNRSELIRDLVREALVDERVEDASAQVVGSLTIVFDHDSHDLRDKLDAIQHAHCSNIVSTTHVHLDEHACLEVIIMRGESRLVRTLANAISGTKGVLHGKLVVRSVRQASASAHGHGHCRGLDRSNAPGLEMAAHPDPVTPSGVQVR